ncbi:MAG: hypothetical protein R3E66_10920 [bacterium]
MMWELWKKGFNVRKAAPRSFLRKFWPALILSPSGQMMTSVMKAKSQIR